MPRPIQPSAFSYLLPTLVQSGDNTQSSGASGWTPGGALSLQIPDNTRIGGNPRGLGAVDLQTQRTAATQVASGAGSFLAGVNNTASGAQSTASGSGNTASGAQAAAFGSASTASGSGSFAVGTSTASGLQSFAAGASTASAPGSIAMGSSIASGFSVCVALAQTTASSDFAFAVGSGTATQTWASSLGASYASGAYSTAAGDSSASGADSFAAGNSSAGGSYSAALGRGSASGSYSAALGYSSAAQTGKFSQSGSRFAATGDSQTGMLVVRAATTNATPTVATSDGSAAGTANQLILSNNSAFTFSILVVARQQAAGGTESAAFEIKGLIRREANAASTTLVNSATTVISNAPGWAVAVSADTTNGGLAITVTGAASTNIRWVATAYTSEVIYA